MYVCAAAAKVPAGAVQVVSLDAQASGAVTTTAVPAAASKPAQDKREASAEPASSALTGSQAVSGAADGKQFMYETKVSPAGFCCDQVVQMPPYVWTLHFSTLYLLSSMYSTVLAIACVSSIYLSKQHTCGMIMDTRKTWRMRCSLVCRRRPRPLSSSCFPL